MGKASAIVLQFIPGMMIGIEFPPQMVVVDFLILRFMFIWGITKEERKQFDMED